MNKYDFLVNAFTFSRVDFEENPTLATESVYLKNIKRVKRLFGHDDVYKILRGKTYKSLLFIGRERYRLRNSINHDRIKMEYLELVFQEYTRRMKGLRFNRHTKFQNQSGWRFLDINHSDYLLIIDKADINDIKTAYTFDSTNYPHCGHGPIHRKIAEKKFGDIKGFFVDHVNSIVYDVRRCNLRKCTRAQNSANSSRRKTGSSGYKGVSKVGGGYYMTQIRLNDKSYNIGRFKSDVDAAIAHDIYAKKYRGEFAKLNFPDASRGDMDRVIGLILSVKRNQKSSSKYYGVMKVKRYNRWLGTFTYRLKRHYLGYFDTEEEAARNVDAKLNELGYLRKLNFKNHPCDWLDEKLSPK